jgi:hypothetical protein
MTSIETSSLHFRSLSTNAASGSSADVFCVHSRHDENLGECERTACFVAEVKHGYRLRSAQPGQIGSRRGAGRHGSRLGQWGKMMCNSFSESSRRIKPLCVGMNLNAILATPFQPFRLELESRVSVPHDEAHCLSDPVSGKPHIGRNRRLLREQIATHF